MYNERTTARLTRAVATNLDLPDITLASFMRLHGPT